MLDTTRLSAALAEGYRIEQELGAVLLHHAEMRRPVPSVIDNENTSSQCCRGGGTKRRECRSYAWASASTRASSPGTPTTDRLRAGSLSAPSPAGTDTSGSPSQLL